MPLRHALLRGRIRSRLGTGLPLSSALGGKRENHAIQKPFRRNCHIVSCLCMLEASTITVSNESDVAMTNVVLSGTGFYEEIPLIAPGESYTLNVRPNGESGLSIKFASGSSVIYKDDLGYLEDSDFYHVTIVVGKGNVITSS